MASEFAGVSDPGPWLERFELFRKRLGNPTATSGSPPVTTFPESPPARPRLTDIPGVGLLYMHGFVNSSQHTNDCAQAAISSVIIQYRLPVHLEIPRNQSDPDDPFPNLYPANDAFVDAVWNDYPTNAPFWPIDHMFTYKEQIANGLRGYGMDDVAVCWAAGWSNGQESWDCAYKWLAASLPVVVLLDLVPLGFPRFSYHYPVLWGFGERGVYLTNMGSYSPLNWYKFMECWHCGALPYPNNFAFVVSDKR